MENYLIGWRKILAVITIIIIELNILVSFRVIKERGRERERGNWVQRK